MKKALLVVALLPASAGAVDLSLMEGPELCILSYMGLIAGASVTPVPPAEINAELTRRAFACEPASIYLEVAKERIRRMDDLEASAAVMRDQMDRDRDQRRREALRQFGNQMLNTPSAPSRPQTTNCQPNGIGGVSCTTW